MVTYEIQGNDVFRDGKLIARITPERLISFLDDDDARFSGHVGKFLAEQGRYDRETGEAVYIVPESQETPPAAPEEMPEPEEGGREEEGGQEDRPAGRDEAGQMGTLGRSGTLGKPGEADAAGKIESIVDLVDLVAAKNGETPPCFSPFFGDATPDVRAFLKRHAAAIALLKKSCGFSDYVENVLKNLEV